VGSLLNITGQNIQFICAGYTSLKELTCLMPIRTYITICPSCVCVLFTFQVLQQGYLFYLVINFC